MTNHELFTTIVGLKNYEGSKVFKIGSIVKLVKEPDNDFDLEAIACEMKYIGKVGYIANSTRTVTKGTMSAGRIYDKIEIIELAKKINTYETSILPFEDCCTIFVPKHPVINPSLEKCELEESKFDYETLVNECYHNIFKVELTEKFNEYL